MSLAETTQGVVEVRAEVFRLTKALARDVPPGAMTAQAIEALTRLHAAAYLLGEVERFLAQANGSTPNGRCGY